jgi:hypothetical protein
VRRVDDEHGVELEANRPRLDIADPGQQQCGNRLAVAEAPTNAMAQLLENPFARRVFEQSHERFDLTAEPNAPLIDRRVDG